MSDTPFMNALTHELIANRDNAHTDNYDAIQLGPEPADTEVGPVWKQCMTEAFAGAGLVFGRFRTWLISSLLPVLRPAKRFVYYYFLPNRYYSSQAAPYKDVSYLYNLVQDQHSRELLVKLFAYRILGHRKVKLPRNNPQYWADIENIAQYKTSDAPIAIKFMDAKLAMYDFAPLGYDLKTYASGPGSACAFVQKQYEYHVGGAHCKAEAGDIAIDAGGCWGETTLYFAHEVGPNGKVVSFEFIPSNLEVMRKNLALNPELAKRITVVDRPVWDYTGLKLYYVDWGPGSRVTNNERQYQYDGTCETISIDDMVAQQKLPRVDFIKMDIETAEFPALRGAEKTLKAYRPKLAISIYHQLSDFITIPKYLNELGLGYDFYIDHHTIYQNETVLFAIPRKQAAVNPIAQAA